MPPRTETTDQRIYRLNQEHRRTHAPRQFLWLSLIIGALLIVSGLKP